jgi:septal ring factor EnvC (AmiA/AmiB activator)
MRRPAANLLLPVGALLLLLSQVIYGADRGKELEGIKRKIKREKQGITKVKEKEGSVLQSLEKIEKRLEGQISRLKKINVSLKAISMDLQKTEREEELLSLSLRVRRRLFKKRARALYKWQRGGSPFILLNGGGSITELMRRKRYLELMLAKDRELVDDLHSESAKQKSLKKALVGKRKNLDEQKSALLKVKGSIRQERKKKRQILARLKRKKKARTRVLKELEQAAHRLQNMMNEITRKPTVKPVRAYPGKGFAAVKGKLPFPVRGKVVGGFGKTSHPEFPAEVFRKGIDIKAPLGEEIKAVETGRVIFSGRFSGYGKMIIIDHGERYYTVYAHLYEILKKSGENAQKGEAIALVGDSGSLQGSRLYFEIRKDGQPLDPLRWLGRQ